MAQWIYDLNFIGLTTAWLASGFLLEKLGDSIAKRIRRRKKKKAVAIREAQKKKQEAYEAWLFRRNDPHYYGD